MLLADRRGGNWIEPFDPGWSGGTGGRDYTTENNGYTYTRHGATHYSPAQPLVRFQRFCQGSVKMPLVCI